MGQRATRRWGQQTGHEPVLCAPCAAKRSAIVALPGTLVTPVVEQRRVLADQLRQPGGRLVQGLRLARGPGRWWRIGWGAGRGPGLEPGDLDVAVAPHNPHGRERPGIVDGDRDGE